MYQKYFQRKMRANETKTSFTCLRSNAPENLTEFMYTIHQSFDDCLPNDWIYETAHTAFDELSNDPIDKITIEPDVYNHELIEWLNNPYALSVIGECQENDATLDFLDIIRCAQIYSKDRIYSMVNDFMQENPNSEKLNE